MMDTMTAAQAADDRYGELETYAQLYAERYGHRLNVIALAATDATYQRLSAGQVAAR